MRQIATKFVIIIRLWNFFLVTSYGQKEVIIR